MNITFFWYMTPYSLVAVYWCSGRIGWPHLQGRRFPWK